MERESLTAYLSSFLTPRRRETLNKVLDQRTRYLTVVLEDIYQSHNASAVLRSCDGFGIQDVHIIENRNRYKTTRDVDMGTSQWLSLKRHNRNSHNTIEALREIRRCGYRIVATTPHTGDVPLEEFDLEKGPVALVFGTEMEGITDEVRREADEFLRIPMYGFVESFNISVACALSLHHLSWKLRSSPIDWALTEEERRELLLHWLRTTVKNAGPLEEEYRRRYSES